MIAALAVTVLVPSPTQDRGNRSARYERTGTFAAAAIRESSGVAVSRRHRGTLWTHNDSGDDPVLYLTDLRGRDLGRRWIRGARAVDWEDIAAGPCPNDRASSCLYIGDTGDNLAQREWVEIYVVQEPTTLEGFTDTLDVLHRLRVRFPTGSPNTEAIGVDDRASVWLVPKGTTGHPKIFRFDAPAFSRDTVTAQLAGQLAFGMVSLLGRVPTGAAISRNGRRLVVRTYTELHFYNKDEHDTWTPDGSPCWLGFAEELGEAVDFLDDSTVVLTSEGLGHRRGALGKAWCEDGG